MYYVLTLLCVGFIWTFILRKRREKRRFTNEIRDNEITGKRK